VTLSERVLGPEVAEDWIREALRLHPQGVRLTVSGSCMEPSLAEGSKVTLATPTRAVRVGDVVLLRIAAGLRLHRVLWRFSERIRTKGDRGMFLDPAAPVSAVIAVCETNESRVVLWVRAVRSLGRLFARCLRPASAPPDRGDAAHSRLLA